MTVQDNRNYGPGFFTSHLKITQEVKDAWIAQLESAGSTKALGRIDTEDGAACGLGHLLLATGRTEATLDKDLIADIVRLNDVEQLSLPEIAVWVKENVEVTE